MNKKIFSKILILTCISVENIKSVETSKPDIITSITKPKSYPNYSNAGSLLDTKQKVSQILEHVYNLTVSIPRFLPLELIRYESIKRSFIIKSRQNTLTFSDIFQKNKHEIYNDDNALISAKNTLYQVNKLINKNRECVEFYLMHSSFTKSNINSALTKETRLFTPIFELKHKTSQYQQYNMHRKTQIQKLITTINKYGVDTSNIKDRLKNLSSDCTNSSEIAFMKQLYIVLYNILFDEDISHSLKDSLDEIYYYESPESSNTLNHITKSLNTSCTSFTESHASNNSPLKFCNNPYAAKLLSDQDSFHVIRQT